jgi:hypothetical protein
MRGTQVDEVWVGGSRRKGGSRVEGAVSGHLATMSIISAGEYFPDGGTKIISIFILLRGLF